MKWCTPVQTLPPPPKICSQKKITKQIITCHAHTFMPMWANTSFEYTNFKKDYEKNNHLPCPTKNTCSPKTDYETNNHLPCPTKNYVVWKQTTKQIITCRAQQKNMKSENRLRNEKSLQNIPICPSPHSSFHTPAPKELYSLKTKYKTNNHSSLYIHMPMWKIISFESCCHPHATTKICSLKKTMNQITTPVTNSSMSIWKILSYESYNVKEKIYILKLPITCFCPHDPW